MQMKWWMTIITLILLCGSLPIRVSAELSAAEGILRSEHRQRSYELRWEQQLYLDRKRAQALSPSEQRRLRNLLLDQQLRQEQLQQQQRLEQTLLRRRLEMQPGLVPGPALQLQLQRFRQEEASQRLHFKLQWDLR
jgi:hypothetical protein